MGGRDQENASTSQKTEQLPETEKRNINRFSLILPRGPQGTNSPETLTWASCVPDQEKINPCYVTVQLLGL